MQKLVPCSLNTSSCFDTLLANGCGILAFTAACIAQSMHRIRLVEVLVPHQCQGCSSNTPTVLLFPCS
jgi:hypothetical protein